MYFIFKGALCSFGEGILGEEKFFHIINELKIQTNMFEHLFDT